MSHRFISYIVVLTLFLGACASQSPEQSAVKSVAVMPVASQNNAPGVPLSLKEFFQFPVGPKGLAPSQKLLSLHTKRVRVSGFMVKEEEPSKGLFMLAPLPVSTSEKEDGPADDLPPATLYVHMPQRDAEKVLEYRPGLWELTGILSVGNQQEQNGRVSYTRLLLD
jgi:hypothetical protein